MSEGLTDRDKVVVETVENLWAMPIKAFLGPPKYKLALYAPASFKSIYLTEEVPDSADLMYLREEYIAHLLGHHYTPNMKPRVLFEYLRYLSGNRVRLPLKRIHKLREVEACHSAFLKSEKDF